MGYIVEKSVDHIRQRQWYQYMTFRILLIAKTFCLICDLACANLLVKVKIKYYDLEYGICLIECMSVSGVYVLAEDDSRSETVFAVSVAVLPSPESASNCVSVRVIAVSKSDEAIIGWLSFPFSSLQFPLNTGSTTCTSAPSRFRIRYFAHLDAADNTRLALSFTRPRRPISIQLIQN